MSKTLRLLIVDDTDCVRQGLRTALSLVPDVEVVGEAADGLQAYKQVEALQPDAVLMDLQMPAMDGYEAAWWIKRQFPGCRVVALTVHDYPFARQKAELAGVDAVVVKGSPIKEVIQAVFGLETASIE